MGETSAVYGVREGELVGGIERRGPEVIENGRVGRGEGEGVRIAYSVMGSQRAHGSH